MNATLWSLRVGLGLQVRFVNIEVKSITGQNAIIRSKYIIYNTNPRWPFLPDLLSFLSFFMPFQCAPSTRSSFQSNISASLFRMYGSTTQAWSNKIPCSAYTSVPPYWAWAQIQVLYSGHKHSLCGFNSISLLRMHCDPEIPCHIFQYKQHCSPKSV